MSIYLDEKNPGKHKPFEDASPDIVEYVRYLEVIAGKSANTAFSYFCDLRGFSRFMKRRRGLVPEDSEMQDIDPKGLDTASSYKRTENRSFVRGCHVDLSGRKEPRQAQAL